MANRKLEDMIYMFTGILEGKGFEEEDDDGIQITYSKMENTSWLEDERRKRNTPLIVIMKKTGAWTYYYKGRAIHKGNVMKLLPF